MTQSFVAVGQMAGKKAEVHQTLQDYYKKHELFFLWQIDRVLVGTLKAVDHTRYPLPEKELLLAHGDKDRSIFNALSIPTTETDHLMRMQRFIAISNAKIRERHKEKIDDFGYNYPLDNCTYCVVAFDSYMKGIQTYPLDHFWPMSSVRLLDFYGIDYDYKKMRDTGRSPSHGKGWLRDKKQLRGGLSIEQVKKALGKNSMGVLGIYGPSPSPKLPRNGHIYNIYSQKNAVVFVDIQAGQILSPYTDHKGLFFRSFEKPFELLIVKGLELSQYPPQEILLTHGAIQKLIMTSQKHSVKYITKLIPKEFGEDYSEGYNSEKGAHPIIYSFPLLRETDDVKMVTILMFGKVNKKSVPVNKRLGKTMVIKVNINGKLYIYDRYGNLHPTNKLDKNLSLTNDTFIPIEGNPGKKL